MPQQQPPELFAQRPVRSEYYRTPKKAPFRFRRVLFLAVALAAFIGVGYGVSSFLDDAPSIDGDIPHIQAAYPVKERPDNPGGIDIPHQDVEVFEQLDNKGPIAATSAVEHLLPEPETPQPVVGDQPEEAEPSLVGATATPDEAPVVGNTSPTEAVASQFEPVSEIPPVEPPKEIKAEVPAETKTEPTKPVEAKLQPDAEPAKPKVEEKEKTVVVPVPKEETATARLPSELFTGEKKTAAVEKTFETAKPSGKLARVQIASFPEETAAQKDVATFSKRFAGSLSGARLEVVRADISGKGTFYRIVTEKIPEEQAISVCDSIKKNKGSCLIIR